MAKGGAGKQTRKHHKAERASLPAATPAERGRAARRNAAAQMRRHRQQRQLEAFRTASGAAAPPRVVSVVALGHGADAAAVCRTIRRGGGGGAVAAAAAGGEKGRFTALRPGRGVHAVLEAAKAADVLLLVLDAVGGLDARGEQLLDAVCLQGVGSVAGVLQGVGALPARQQAGARRKWAASLEARFPENARMFSDDVDADGAQLMRHLCALTPRQLSWRKNYAYVLSHGHAYTADEAGPRAADGTAAEGTLEVFGYVRGQPLSVDRLVHIPGVGDSQPLSVEVLPDPFPLAKEARGHKEDGEAMEAMEAEGMEVHDGASGQSLALLLPSRQVETKYEAEPDDLANEQTWPTPQELEAAQKSHAKAEKTGEEYAQGWTAQLDEEEAEGEGGMYGEEEGTVMGDEHVDMDEADEMESRRRFLMERAQRDDDAKFPDEVDTPIDQPARVRFARYRGLKSFRASPWHPQENLPPAYARIYQFEDWPALQKQAMQRQAEEESVAFPGSFVKVTLRVGSPFVSLYGAQGTLNGEETASTLILSSVNEHENRLSVVHFTISLTAAAEAQDLTLRGKQPLVFHCGFRRFLSQPIYSEDTRRSDKHRLERFLQPGRPSVATVYAPALYAPAPLLAFLPSGSELAVKHEGLRELPVAAGALLSVDPNRIILKKVMLTGHPFRCHKKKAVVRWMFFSPEDIRWFKPIELHTKFGRKGCIRESLGTRGYMKCIFDGAIYQHDTVCMSLYKRAFPKLRSFSYLCDGAGVVS